MRINFIFPFIHFVQGKILFEAMAAAEFHVSFHTLCLLLD